MVTMTARSALRPAPVGAEATVTILGATGSVGTSTVDLIARTDSEQTLKVGSRVLVIDCLEHHLIVIALADVEGEPSPAAEPAS